MIKSYMFSPLPLPIPFACSGQTQTDGLMGNVVVSPQHGRLNFEAFLLMFISYYFLYYYQCFSQYNIHTRVRHERKHNKQNNKQKVKSTSEKTEVPYSDSSFQKGFEAHFSNVIFFTKKPKTKDQFDG